MKLVPIATIPGASRRVLWLGAGLLLAAGVIHAVSDLPSDYTWMRTLDLFWASLTDAYFMVMALLVLAVTPRHASSSVAGWTLVTFTLSVSTCLVLLWFLGLHSYEYTMWDYAAMLPAGLLFVYSLRGRSPGQLFFGVIASMLILMLVSYVFTIFKSQLFRYVAPLDHLIVSFEAAIFGKPLYLIIAEWAKDHLPWVAFSDWVYYLFFHHMALTALFLFARGNRAEQWRYVTSLALCYLFGGLAYYVVPAWGPAYHDPTSFAYLKSSARFTYGIQDYLLSATHAAAQGTLSRIDTFAFVAAMPSLHMAHESIMLFYSRSSPLMAVFSGLFWLSSCAAVLILGWHYLSDVFGGIVLAVVVLFLARRDEPLRISGKLRPKRSIGR